jgi:hypothetical protein
MSFPNIWRITLIYITWALGAVAVFLSVVVFIARPITLVGFVLGIVFTLACRELSAGSIIAEVIDRIRLVKLMRNLLHLGAGT